MRGKTGKGSWVIVPLFGIPLYLVLYGISTRFYPGGSEADPHAIGFSWIHNYWCNLLDRFAMNGEPNEARPMAMVAMGLLCIALSVFFVCFPHGTSVKAWVKGTVRFGGVAAMTCGALMGVFDHDLMTNIASLFGILAVGGTLIILKRRNWNLLFRMGLAIILLVGLNNLFYYTDNLRLYLPVVQKLTFLWVLAWVWLVSRKAWLTSTK